MTDSVDGFVFDLDGTLCEYRRSGRDVLAGAFEAASKTPFFTVEEYYQRFEEYVPDSADIREVREQCFADLAAEAGRDPDDGRAVAHAYAEERDHADVEWLPGAREAVDTLGERYPLAMVTNGDPWMQGTKLEALGVEDRFETVVYAGFDAPAKPDPEPFDRAVTAMDVPAQRAVTVGNSLQHDVAGAHNAGLRSVWLDHNGTTTPDPEPNYRIESMHELLEAPWH